jgi:hypothetical protein
MAVSLGRDTTYLAATPASSPAPHHPEIGQSRAQEVYEKWRDKDDPPYLPPLHFQKWVEETFGVDIPRTASAIVTKLAHLDDADSDDPFWYWIWKQQGRWEPSSLH